MEQNFYFFFKILSAPGCFLRVGSGFGLFSEGRIQIQFFQSSVFFSQDPIPQPWQKYDKPWKNFIAISFYTQPERIQIAERSKQRGGAARPVLLLDPVFGRCLIFI